MPILFVNNFSISAKGKYFVFMDISILHLSHPCLIIVVTKNQEDIIIFFLTFLEIYT